PVAPGQSWPPVSARAHLLCNAPPTPALYTLSLHDALPISILNHSVANLTGRSDHLKVARYLIEQGADVNAQDWYGQTPLWAAVEDRKSTRLNSSHVKISYAVFCLKKKKRAHYRLLVRGPGC